MIKELNENELLESKELRSKLIARTDVLEKVKSLLLIPEMNEATMQQVADYYEVGLKAIETISLRHKDELNEDGMINKSYKNFLNIQHEGLETVKGKATFIFKSGEILNVPMRGLKVFPRRAILRIGMLLRDSEIAKEVRTQLLNIEEKTSDEIKVQDINEEQKLMLEVGMAFASGNTTAIMIATTNMMGFKNRHIEKLEIANKALANGILEWEDRSRINFAVRKLAQSAHLQYGQLWNELYKQLKNKYHIDLKARGKQPWIQYIEEKEWNCVIKSFSALCAYYKQEPSDMFCDLEIQEVQ